MDGGGGGDRAGIGGIDLLAQGVHDRTAARAHLRRAGGGEVGIAGVERIQRELAARLEQVRLVAALLVQEDCDLPPLWTSCLSGWGASRAFVVLRPLKSKK